MKIVRQPLQPYEQDLIRILGCTVEEYEQHVEYVRRRSMEVRPAAYNGVPDVQAAFIGAAAWFFIANVAVGVALSAVSYLLAPKPRAKKVQEQRTPTSTTLDSIKGSTRFNETSGFESAVSLAEYGAPVAIMFGRWTGTTGGIIAKPSLVWSRMRTFGHEDGIKTLFVVGETGIDPPELDGIYLGNQPLNSVFKLQFAFYWVNREGNSRVRGGDLKYGTRGGRETGDPQGTDDVFLVPSRTVGVTGPHFCGAFTPTSSRDFGAHSPIRNGTAYRLNWRVIPFLKIPLQEDDPGGRIRSERRKISGAARVERVWGQDGDGRAYSGRCGLVIHNGTEYSDAAMIDVNIGDLFQYRIAAGTFSNDGYAANVNNQDVQETVDGYRIAADDAMQVGELFVCGRVVLQCEQRLNGGVLDTADYYSDRNYLLRVVEVLGNFYANRTIGICGTRALYTDVLYEGDNYDETTWVGTYGYPLLRASFAIVKNQRAVDVTEVGLASEVWNLGGGVCNFSAMPIPSELVRADKNQNSLTVGTNSSYMPRSSAFTVQIRRSGTGDGWFDTGFIYVITGSRPTVQRTWLRFTHPSTIQCEFRFVPVTGAALYRQPGTMAVQVDLKPYETVVRYIEVPNMGQMGITAPGRYVSLGSLFPLREMSSVSPVATDRFFEYDTQIADISYYDEIRKSNDTKAEHSITYVNEITENPRAPEYSSMALAGLAFRAARNFDRLDAPRFWLPNGVPVERLTEGGVGPSNLLTDLMYQLYTSKTMGAGSVVSPTLLDRDDLSRTGNFLLRNGLLFDGAISEPINLAAYFSSVAPLFLCDVVKRSGKLSLSPAVPTTTAGTISTGAVPIAAIFNAGNILEGSFNLDYLNKEERKDFRAIVKWRQGAKNQLPETRTAQVRWADTPNLRDTEEFDLSAWCTSREQALKTARFVLSLRRRVRYSVKFTAFPDGLVLATGDYIRVNLESAPYSSVRNGVIHPDTGAVSSVQKLVDGSYPVIIYRPGMPDSIDETLTISNGIAQNRAQWGSIFTVKAQTTSLNVFNVESLTLTEDCLVEITGVHHPVTDSLQSQLALDVLDPSLFVVVE
jgi:hypothetical protein